MSHIYIYSPSSAVRDKAAFRRGVRRLQQLGHEVEIDPSALDHHMRFAGDDATRLAAIGRAAASGADIALISRGGYGLTRLLPDLPYKAIARSIERGTQWVGLSDFTALQLATLAKTGAITWAGPALGEDFGVAGTPDDIMEACFDDLVQGHGEGAGWRLPVSDGKAFGPDYRLKIDKAPLWGGNLSLLGSLVGTPWLPTIRKGVLFLEDVGEHPYRLERELTQLLHAGILDQQRAIFLGAFNKYTPVAGYDRGFGLASMVEWLRSKTRTPIFTGLPFGHVPTKVLLPVGAEVEVLVEGRAALIVWD